MPEDETRLLMESPEDEGSPPLEQPLFGASEASPLAVPPPPVTHPSPGRPSSSVASDFQFIKILARITLQLIRRFWAFSSATMLAILLFYWLWGGFIALLLVIFAISGILYQASDKVLYHPDQPNTSRVFIPSPSIVGLPFESIYIRSKDKTRLHLFLIKQSPEQISEAPTILFLHGNAGNIGHRLLNVKGMYSQLQCNICLLEYRGYGHSDGSPSEEGLYMDAQAGLDYLSSRSDINASKIVVFGRSLGGAVAIELSARPENREKVACLLVENTFTSIPDIARSLFDFRIVRAIPTWFYKNQFKSRWKVCKISVPVLFLSGLADALIPPKMMNELFNSCGSETKRLARFPNGNHNETWTCQQYYPAIRYFLNEVVGFVAASGHGPTPGAPVRIHTPPSVLVSHAGIL
eukprot:maker-scaffold515_size150689-snap-gene-0.32 protein:Tk06540 transcript:maker-scaffold515_size150689-snap-gene-0.32-mRNA-1 annotation:"abhydrolase domain-containing protein 13"